MRQYFIVTSHGWSASNWLAFAINLHSEIICTHSARNMIASEKNMNSDHHLKNELDRLHQGYLLRQNRSLDDGYDEIERYGNAKSYGSVHVYRMRDLPVLYEKFGPPKRSFQVMNLIRHPVSLVWSGYGQFKQLLRYDLNELHWTVGKVLHFARSFVFDLAKRYDLYIGDSENLSFLCAAAVLSSLRLDFDADAKIRALPGIDFHGHIKMEDVTTRKKDFAKALNTLCPDHKACDPGYLENVFATGVVNAHKNDPNKHDAQLRYSRFTDWQKEAFNHFLNLFQLRNNYEKIGYDLSFL